MCEYMTIIETHNKSLHKTPNQQWKGWLEAGLNTPRISVHKMATIVKYPKKREKTLKLVGIYILTQTPTLARFVRILSTCKQHEPLCNVNKPVIVMKGHEANKNVVKQIEPRALTDTEEEPTYSKKRQESETKSSTKDTGDKLSEPTSFFKAKMTNISTPTITTEITTAVTEENQKETQSEEAKTRKENVFA